MMTLWKKLPKESRKKLKETTTLGATTKKNLIFALKNEVAFTQLKFEYIIFLVQELTKNDKDYLSLMLELFNFKK
jgi:hypothetical protein